MSAEERITLLRRVVSKMDYHPSRDDVRFLLDQIAVAESYSDVDAQTAARFAGEAVLLRQAVCDYLTQSYEDDLFGSRPSWPSELQRLVGWVAPDE